MNINFHIPGVVQRRFISDTKGRGLFAERSFEKDEIIFSEYPMFSVQHVYNRPIAWTCGNCFRFLGSLDRQVAHYRKAFGIARDKTELGEFPEGSNPHDFSTGIYSCFAKCGEKYCSEECRKHAFDNHHQLLCVGEQTPENSPIYQFKKHAIDSNELFLLGAQVIAFLVCRVVNDNSGAPLADTICSDLLQNYAHRGWWDVRIDGNFSHEEAKRWAGESLTLLQKAFAPMLAAHPKTNNPAFISQILSMDFYSHVLGMLEMNDNSIRFTSPLESFRREVDSLPSLSPAHKQHSNNVLKSVVKAFRDYHAEDDCDEDDHEADEMDQDKPAADEAMTADDGNKQDDDEEEEEVFPPFDGYGMFGLQAMVNHNCEPNCFVQFVQGNSYAHIRALKPIKAGEELWHSYIEESNPFEEREQDLITYGFQCDCRLCNQERPRTTSSSS
eukprot:gene10796-12580_t